MIRRYDFGNPLPTDATVLSIQPESGDPAGITVETLESGIRLTLPLTDDTQIFGLGQAVRGIDKRGHIYRSWNTDEVLHTENKQSLYGTHNFLLLVSPENPQVLGLFVDDPGDVRFDLGATDPALMQITSVNGDFSLYCLSGDTPIDVCRSFRELIGQSYVPPFWAFGYIQSRWGYTGEADVMQVVKAHREKHIPLDGVCMDIDYMDRFRDFTWSPERVPDLPGMVARLKKENIHLIPIIDAGIPVDAEDEACRSGLENDAFVKREDGSYFQAAVWPGFCYFTDYLNSRSRQWFGDQYRPLLEAGIEGFWNDMNEPSLFYSKEGIAAALKEIWDLQDTVQDGELDSGLCATAKAALHRAEVGLASSPTDYSAFWHDMDGRKVRHDKVHNLYGFGMTRASQEGMTRFDPDRRFLLFSRSTCIGSHRYGGMWMGDNCSWWSHLRLNLQMLPGLNMCGFLYCGADLGGFAKDVTPDLLLRWLELGIFTPLMRNHTAIHTRDQEIYRFSCWQDMRNIVTLRYALLPFLYSEFLKAVHNSDLLFLPMAFVFPADPVACHIQDQVMLTEHCMIAPVLEQNAIGRLVYLPEDMVLLRMRSAADIEAEVMEKGAHFVPCALNEALLFIRKGVQIPLVLREMESTADLRNNSSFTMAGWENAEAYDLWQDDGEHRSAGISRTALSPANGASPSRDLLR